MPKLKSYGVFISHAWDYDADYYRLERMLNNAKCFRWRNCSVPQCDPRKARSDAQLEKALRNQIRPANAVVIISGMYVKHRKWIQKEIDIAREMKKPIIGLAPRGAQRIPSEVQKIAPIKRWMTSEIVDAIRRARGPITMEIAPQVEVAQADKESATRDWNKTVDEGPGFAELLDWIDSTDSAVTERFDRRGRVATRRGGMSG